ncbi:MAG TPA: hypothetical protein VKV35_05730 [Streptosporangiaceae bacterium]|nr:hypothetical protein [Streptosporangiaceae bacterium]
MPGAARTARSQAAWPPGASRYSSGPPGVTSIPAGTSSRTVPAAARGPQATVSRRPARPAGSGSATLVGDRCTATGRFPAGAGPVPCSQ